jgi:hypothetical protein
MLVDPRARTDRLARVDQMIKVYAEAKHRRLLRRAIKLWRRTEAYQLTEKHEAQPHRVH